MASPRFTLALHRGQTPTAVGFGKNSENPECESPAITAGRGSPIFLLTQASVGRINKQEPTHAKPLKREIQHSSTHFSIQSQPQIRARIIRAIEMSPLKSLCPVWRLQPLCLK
jgi:hypothetical protein